MVEHFMIKNDRPSERFFEDLSPLRIGEKVVGLIDDEQMPQGDRPCIFIRNDVHEIRRKVGELNY